MSKKLIGLVLVANILIAGGCSTTADLKDSSKSKIVTTTKIKQSNDDKSSESKEMLENNTQVKEKTSADSAEKGSNEPSTNKVKTTTNVNSAKTTTTTNTTKKQLSQKSPVTTIKKPTVNSPKVETVNTIGNSSGNIANEGYAAKQGDWIYYVYISENPSNSANTGLYKMKEDGSNKTKLISGYFRNINVIGEWIYYYDFESDGLYKIKTDGKGKTLIRKGYVGNVNVVGDKIYFTSLEGLLKMNLDGSSDIKLAEGNIKNISISKEYIYYINQDELRIYKMKLDGSEMQKVIDERAYDMKQAGNYIFFTMPLEEELPRAGNNILYRVNLDGIALTKIDDRNIRDFNLDSQYLYVYGVDYVNGDGIPNIYRMKYDGSGKTKISSKGGIMNLTVLDDWIYFKSTSYQETKDRLCRMKLDGSGYQVIN